MGFSFGAVIGYQLTLHCDRVAALVMGGFPPLEGPYAEMLQLSSTICTEGGSYYGMKMPVTGDLHRQFVTYYERMQEFDDRAAASQLGCPRLAYMGDADRPDLNGETLTDMGQIVQRNQAELESLGWKVQIHPGKGHLNWAAEETSAIIAEFFNRHFLS